MSDIYINKTAAREQLSVIEKDIDEIADLLGKVVKANETFTERAWTAKEKRKLDQEYMPYLKKVAVNAPNSLKFLVNRMRKNINTYQETEREIIQGVKTNLEDFSE